MDTDPPILEISNLHVVFGQGGAPVKAVQGVDLSIRHGETLALVGESGSGKSVTALSIARLNPEPPARYPSGDIRVQGRSVLDMGSRELRRLRGGTVSYIFQEPAVSLNPVLTIEAQIREALHLHQRDVPSREEALRLLDIVGITNARSRLKAYPHELSGGMQQRVMIAMALACRPALLIADEPTTALDVTIQQQILRLLRQLQDSFDMAVLFITHNLALVAELADRVMVMREGKIVERGEVEAVLRAPSDPYTQKLLAAVPRLGVGAYRIESKPLDAAHLFRRAGADEAGMDDDGPLLSAEDIHVQFGRGRRAVHALQGVSLEVQRGDSLGLVGESGSGKTTLARCFMGMQPVRTGDVLHRGRSLRSLKPEAMQALRRDVQMVFQDPYGSLNPRMSIGSMMVEALKVHRIVEPAGRWKRSAECLERVGLPADTMSRYPHEFSGGQRQRIVIARALALQPSVLVADEPVSALDVSIQDQILSLLKSLQEELTLTLIFVSHDLAVVRHLCSRIAVMHQGRILETGRPERVIESPRDPYTQKLLAAVPDVDAGLARRRVERSGARTQAVFEK